MSLITNYWADPYFYNANGIAQINCKISDATHDCNPSAGIFPKIFIKTTGTGDARAERHVAVPVGMKIVAACAAGNDGNPNVGHAFTLWTRNGSAYLGSCPANGGVSDEFTVPAEGFKICFQAPTTVGKTRWVGNVFIGTKADYEALLKYVPSGFCAGDLMPQQN